MNFILLISLDNQIEEKWSLIQDLYAVEKNGKWSFSGIDGVTPIGLHAVLFDRTKAHETYVQVCAYLLDKKSPYFVLYLDQFSMLVAGQCETELQAIVKRFQAREALVDIYHQQPLS